jgi:hypothetical protein
MPGIPGSVLYMDELRKISTEGRLGSLKLLEDCTEVRMKLLKLAIGGAIVTLFSIVLITLTT